MARVDVEKLLANLEILQQQSREIFHYKRDHLRSHIRAGISLRQVDRIKKLTTHEDYRGCSDPVSSQKKSQSVNLSLPKR